MNLRVNEIFSSINGEVCTSHQGSLCTFVRLQGCNLNYCSYCDTKYARDKDGGTEMTIEEVVKEINRQGNRNVTITGGEPLVQMDAFWKLISLIEFDYDVSVETNGSIPIPFECSNRLSWVVDYKLPYSNMTKFMKEDNFMRLGCLDFVKFVVASRSDFDFAVRKAVHIESGDNIRLAEGPKFAFSPCSPFVTVNDLQQWMSGNPFLKEIGAILSLQLHKLIGVK